MALGSVFSLVDLKRLLLVVVNLLLFLLDALLLDLVGRGDGGVLLLGQQGGLVQGREVGQARRGDHAGKGRSVGLHEVRYSDGLIL